MPQQDTLHGYLLRRAAALGLALAAAALLQACSNDTGIDPAPDVGDVIGQARASSTRPPNIIIINADDLGYGDPGCYGGQAIQTPAIDSLATQGVRFSDFHSSDSVCTPSRAGLLTGRYAKRMGLDVPLHPEKMSLRQTITVSLGYLAGKIGLMDLATEGGEAGLRGDEITLAEALRVAGYATGMVGKWHLGDFGANPRHNPRRHGFDFFFGVPYSNDMHPFPLYRNEDELESHVADQSGLTRLYTAQAVEFIEASRDEPFFLYFAHTFPHRPLHASAEFRHRSAGGVFGDTVEELDWSVGQVLATLERLSLQDDTIVMFTSDNGPWYQGSPGVHRGRKGQSYEGGHRVPFIVRWPGRIQQGRIERQPAMNIDLFPTCLALAGLTLPNDRIIDGESIEDLLTADSTQPPHEYLFFYHQGELEGVRSGRWKYFRNFNHYVWPMPVNTKMGRLSNHTTGPLPLLFDLETDPGEAYDVASEHPEVARRLSETMADWEQQIRSNRRGWTR